MTGRHGNRRWRLLIVDDEPLLLRALSRVLGRECDVTTIAEPEEALRRLANGEHWDLILSDVTMPGVNGIDFARRAVKTHPELAGRIALMTGGAATPEGWAALEQSNLPLLAKPIDLGQLRELHAKSLPQAGACYASV